MQALPRTNAEHSPRYIDEREAFSMPYWLTRNGPGRLGGHGHSPYRLRRRGIRHATLTINGVRATPPNDAFAQTLANEAHRMGRRRPLFSLPFYPFAPTAPSPNFPFFATLAFFGAKSRS